VEVSDYNPDVSASSFVVTCVGWSANREKLGAVRRAVFVEEQNVPEELEWDDADHRASHVLATDCAGAPIGTGRLKADCYIGRMAVLKPWRDRGVGGAMLKALLAIAENKGCSVVRLHAQTHAIGFYARYGFEAVGNEFDEAGIPHRLMQLKLALSGR
jgi:predicted GNAT family N-acyltransferase